MKATEENFDGIGDLGGGKGLCREGLVPPWDTELDI